MSGHATFFTDHIPRHQDDAAFTSLRNLNDVVSIVVGEGDAAERHRLWFEQGHLRSGEPGDGVEDRTTFRMREETFESIVAGDLSPQSAFFTMRLKIEGDVLFGLQLGTLLAGFFKRHPWRMEDAPLG